MSRSRKFVQRHDNEGWEEKSQRPFRIACCDCGLVHLMTVATETEGQPIGIAARRDNRSTSQRRRRMRERAERDSTAKAGPALALDFTPAPPRQTEPKLITPNLL